MLSGNLIIEGDHWLTKGALTLRFKPRNQVRGALRVNSMFKFDWHSKYSSFMR